MSYIESRVGTVKRANNARETITVFASILVSKIENLPTSQKRRLLFKDKPRNVKLLYYITIVEYDSMTCCYTPKAVSAQTTFILKNNLCNRVCTHMSEIFLSLRYTLRACTFCTIITENGQEQNILAIHLLCTV